MTSGGTNRARTRGPRRDAAENREAILSAAATVLNAEPEASIEAIASAAGLSRRALYGHFPTRDELVDAVLLRGAERIATLLEPLAHSDARVEIALFGCRLWAEVSHVRVMATLAVRDPHAARIAKALEPARKRLRSTVRRGVADGVLRTDIAPDALARLIEGAAISVLDEATRTALSAAAGHRLVMLCTLGTAGLGWREADALIDSTPQLAFPHPGQPEPADPNSQTETP